jgi:hypothetical protein
MMYATAKEEEAIRECYRKLYKASTPPADFDELMNNASIDENGEKVIDFMAHEICEYEFSEIVDEVIKKYKIRTYRQRLFKNAIHIGCSPKFKES